VYAGDNLHCRGFTAACAASITPVGAWFLLLGGSLSAGCGPSSDGAALATTRYNGPTECNLGKRAT
jgi:hypothetical protein